MSQKKTTGSSSAAKDAAARNETEQLRVRLSRAEMQLRDMEEEMKRVQQQQTQELEQLKEESEANNEVIETIRMRECLSPRKLEAQLRAGADSKLLAAGNVKYLNARRRVEEAAARCEEAEARLAAIKEELGDVNSVRKDARRQRHGSTFEAHRRRSTVSAARGLARDQMKSLESRVAHEQARFTEDALMAKSIRGELDTLLITQALFLENYTKRETQLLEKRKEMSFLMEVCTLIYEDREQHMKDLQEITKWTNDENERYENAFQELNSVVEANNKVQKANEAQLEEMKVVLSETKRQRVELENENAGRLEAAEQRRLRLRKPRDAPLADDDSTAPDYVAKYRASMHLDTDDFSDEDLDPVEKQIREFDGYYERLSAIADSDDVEHVVNYLNSSAEDRFRLFNEINLAEDEIKGYESERAQLLEQLKAIHGRAEPRGTAGIASLENGAAAGFPPSPASPAAIAVSRTLRERERQDTQKGAAAADESRVTRIEGLKGELTLTRQHVAEQLSAHQHNSKLLASLVDQTGKMFTALNCPADALLRESGLDRVVPQNVCAALGIVDQRVEEYLVALARRQHQQEQSAGATTTAFHQLDPNQVSAVAKTILRRQDLPPSRAVAPQNLVRERGLPRTGENAAAEAEELPLTHEQIKSLVAARLRLQ